MPLIIRYIAVRTGLFILGVSIAAWLRMFDYSLAWGTWQSLVRQPIRLWLGAILGNPLLELLTFGWAHLLVNLVYGSFARATVRNRGQLRLGPAMLLGLVLWGGLCLLLECLRVMHVRVLDLQLLGQRIQFHWWLYPLPEEVAKLVLIYALTGLLYGALFYHWIARRQAVGKVAI